MNVRVYPAPGSAPISRGAITSDPNQTGGIQRPALDPAHRVGDTVDKVDQVSSVTLLGFAIAGAVAVTLYNLVLG